ncbi:uncharacterized protein [Montipora capricornis]|uniref:uncharacterized protein n=1 Tax=Montipora capricornis TaxID=246305 RepID=UPI0035F20ECB
MGFQLYLAAVFTAFLVLEHCAGSAEQSQSTNRSKHDEIHRAKSQIDSLIYKLTLDLNTFNEKNDLASAMQKDAEKLARIAEEEIALLKPVQHLLEKLANGNTSNRNQTCFAKRGGKIQVQIEAKESALPKHYTINIPVNHRQLIDRGLTRNDGDDLRIYYHENRRRYVQLDRVIKGLGTKSATVQFRLQAPISANNVDGYSYSLVMGDLVSGSAKENPEKVYAFYDDFSSSTLKKDWVKAWGQWSVQNGRLLGSTMQTKDRNSDFVEVGVYLKTGFHWKDVQVELDLMETSGLKNTATGPFLRLSNVNPNKTTGWWLQYFLGAPNHCYLRPQANNKDGSWKYGGRLPTAFQLNKWFHIKYRVIGNRFWQWVNGKLVHNNLKVEKEWEIPAGTLGLGCHKSSLNCKTLYDNIKVTLLVAKDPKITLGLLQPFFFPNSGLLGDKKLPADSCKQIHDASLVNNKPRAKNGVYWIKTDLQGSSAVQTFCDMKNGGWTLVGKISGRVGNIYHKWLVSNYNTAELKTPKISKRNQFACLDARNLAVEEASRVMLSSGEMTDGLGSKWVMWRLPGDREKASFWDHSVGLSAVKAALQKPVMVIAWNGKTKTCFQNKFGIMPYSAHGGSYPYASINTAGSTYDTNDNCMAVGVMSKGSTAHGWSQNGNGYDSSSSDSDWPNKSYSHQSPYVVVWLK